MLLGPAALISSPALSLLALRAGAAAGPAPGPSATPGAGTVLGVRLGAAPYPAPTQPPSPSLAAAAATPACCSQESHGLWADHHCHQQGRIQESVLQRGWYQMAAKAVDISKIARVKKCGLFSLKRGRKWIEAQVSYLKDTHQWKCIYICVHLGLFHSSRALNGCWQLTGQIPVVREGLWRVSSLGDSLQPGFLNQCF